MNNILRYKQDYNEAMAEDAESLLNFLTEERIKSTKSYPEGKKVKYCSICGEPLIYNSVSYNDGFHIDTCI